MEQVMSYPDEILRDLIKNFTTPHWIILQILSGQIDENGSFQSGGKPIRLTLKKLNERISVSPQNFRVLIGLLNGANAVALITGRMDQRAKEVVITNNGLRMLEFMEAN